MGWSSFQLMGCVITLIRLWENVIFREMIFCVGTNLPSNIRTCHINKFLVNIWGSPTYRPLHMLGPKAAGLGNLKKTHGSTLEESGWSRRMRNMIGILVKHTQTSKNLQKMELWPLLTLQMHGTFDEAGNS